MHWVDELLKESDAHSPELIKALASMAYRRPPVAIDSNQQIVSNIGARDAQIRSLYQELFETKLLLAAVVQFLQGHDSSEAAVLSELVGELRQYVNGYYLGPPDGSEPDA